LLAFRNALSTPMALPAALERWAKLGDGRLLRRSAFEVARWMLDEEMSLQAQNIAKRRNGPLNGVSNNALVVQGREAQGNQTGVGLAIV
jgi:hypothetical protein